MHSNSSFEKFCSPYLLPIIALTKKVTSEEIEIKRTKKSDGDTIDQIQRK